jgi:hypothetical protein
VDGVCSEVQECLREASHTRCSLFIPSRLGHSFVQTFTLRECKVDVKGKSGCQKTCPYTQPGCQYASHLIYFKL